MICKALMICLFFQATAKTRVLHLTFKTYLQFPKVHGVFKFFFSFVVMPLHLQYLLSRKLFSPFPLFSFCSLGKFQLKLQDLAGILNIQSFFFFIFPERPENFIICMPLLQHLRDFYNHLSDYLITETGQFFP